MKLSTNEVALIGFVGGDAQAKQTRNKTNYTVVNLAPNDSWKDKQTGEWQKRTQWHRLVGWGRVAEPMLSLGKGVFIQVRGSDDA